MLGSAAPDKTATDRSNRFKVKFEAQTKQLQ
jgi:hypothetical protein